MSEESPASVWAAYELLLEELASEIDWVNRSGAQAFAAGDHARAARALARVKSLEALRGDLRALGQQLRGIVEPRPAAEPRRVMEARDGPPPVGARLAKGLKTPEEAYRLPILRALVELGGSADLNDVLERVYAVMKDRLNEHDLAPMPSDESCPRWRNTAQWARNDLREEGLLKSHSPHGLWEISPAGRAWLAGHSKEG